MARWNLRRYDVQANLGMALSLIAAAPIALAAIRVATRYDADMRAIPYGSGSLLVPAMLASLGIGLLLSVVGMALGFNSAGQRRNDKPARSWLGFFIGAAAFTTGLIVGVAFWMLKVAVV